MSLLVFSRFFLILFLAVLVAGFFVLGSFNLNVTDAQTLAIVIEDDSIFDPPIPDINEFVGETPVDLPNYNNPQILGGAPTPTPTTISNTPIPSSGGGGGGGFSLVPSLTPLPSKTPLPQETTTGGVATPEQQHPRIIKFDNGPQVFTVSANKIKWIPSPEVFTGLGLDWRKLEERPAKEISQYNRVRLIRAEGDSKVYYVTEAGRKRWIPTEAVFNSYGNKWEDIVTVMKIETDAIPDVVLIRAEGDSKVYNLDNGLKRWIVNEPAFNRNNFKWDEIAPVNKVEIDSWLEGGTIN